MYWGDYIVDVMIDEWESVIVGNRSEDPVTCAAQITSSVITTMFPCSMQSAIFARARRLFRLSGRDLPRCSLLFPCIDESVVPR